MERERDSKMKHAKKEKGIITITITLTKKIVRKILQKYTKQKYCCYINLWKEDERTEREGALEGGRWRQVCASLTARAALCFTVWEERSKNHIQTDTHWTENCLLFETSWALSPVRQMSTQTNGAKLWLKLGVFILSTQTVVHAKIRAAPKTAGLYSL